MKEVKAIIQPFKLDEVVNALQAIPGINAITALRATGFGRRRGATGLQVPAVGALNYVAKDLLIVIIPDSLLASVLDTIERHAHTGNYGDGLLYVTPVEEAIRIRTGERGEGAL